MDFETRAIHEGQEPDPATGAIITPIYQPPTEVQDAVGEHKGYDYSRVANPTRHALETALASLESAEHGVAYSSGLGATTTLMHLLNPGDRVVLIADVYGGVYRMTSQVYEPKGYRFDYLPAEDFPSLAEHLDESTRMVWIETPSNPMLNVVDIRAAAVLERDPRVERVLYPGLPTHPGHVIAARQMRDFGGMVSFLAESVEEAEAIAARTRLFQLAESLGGVESLIEVPARMTHAATADAPFAAPENLVRLSVGIESAEDLVADLEDALVPATTRA